MTWKSYEILPATFGVTQLGLTMQEQKRLTLSILERLAVIEMSTTILNSILNMLNNYCTEILLLACNVYCFCWSKI